MAANRTLIFSYGTLKRDLPNHFLMQDLIRSNDAVFVGTFLTKQSHPLVVGPHGIPYLINLPGSGQRVRGELYSVSTRGLGPLDELEGTAIGHYERLPIQVESEPGDGGDAVVEAEAYFAHRSFGEKMWERKGKEGIGEYTEREAGEYVRKVDRPNQTTFLHDIQSFLSCDR